MCQGAGKPAGRFRRAESEGAEGLRTGGAAARGGVSGQEKGFFVVVRKKKAFCLFSLVID